MDKPPLNPMDRQQAIMFAFRLYLPALKKYVATNIGFTLPFPLSNPKLKKIQKVEEFFDLPGNGIGRAIYHATPYYNNPGALIQLL